MTIGLLFWIIFIVWVLFSGYVRLTPSAPPGTPAAQRAIDYAGMGGSLVLIVLIGLLGWAAFGPVVHR